MRALNSFLFLLCSYGDSEVDSKGRRVRWRVVQGCAEVAQSWCDLSNETSDLEHGYVARVRAKTRRASSGWILTRRFDPKPDSKNLRETIFSISVKLHICTELFVKSFQNMKKAFVMLTFAVHNVLTVAHTSRAYFDLRFPKYLNYFFPDF